MFFECALSSNKSDNHNNQHSVSHMRFLINTRLLELQKHFYQGFLTKPDFSSVSISLQTTYVWTLLADLCRNYRGRSMSMFSAAKSMLKINSVFKGKEVYFRGLN